MIFAEYKELTKRTLPDLGSLVLNTVHMSMGFNSETYELAEAFKNKDIVNAGEEIGDKLWYLANYINVNELEFTLEFINAPLVYGDQDSDGTDFFLYETELLDYDKKFLAYGKERNLENMNHMVKKLFASYNNILNSKNLNPSDVMSKNIAKLLIRFPEKFEQDKALIRDLGLERTALEG